LTLALALAEAGGGADAGGAADEEGADEGGGGAEGVTEALVAGVSEGSWQPRTACTPRNSRSHTGNEASASSRVRR
jgi:hypothetical protein